MSDFSDELRDAVASAATDILEQLGESVTYSNRGGATVALYAAVDDITKRASERIGADIEDSTAVFTLARKVNDAGTILFPPTNGVTIDDEITFNSISYHVQDFTVDSTGAIFDLQCNRDQARRLKG